jgi:hypothetical protein
MTNSEKEFRRNVQWFKDRKTLDLALRFMKHVAMKLFYCPEPEKSERKIEDKTCQDDKGPCSRNGKIGRPVGYDAEGIIIPEEKKSGALKASKLYVLGLLRGRQLTPADFN